MDQPGFQQACDYQQNHLVAQDGNDPEGLSLTLTDWCDYDWIYVGCSPNVPGQVVPLFNLQPHSTHSDLIRHWDARHAASSTFGQSPGADLPLSAEVNSILIPYGDTNYESFSGFEQALTAGAALATQRLGEPHSNPRQNSGRCVRCWALRQPVFLFI
jgi:hypothetical protein